MVGEQEIAGQVEKGLALPHQLVQSYLDAGVEDHLAGGLGAVANAGLGVVAGAIQELVTDTFHLAVEDRLAADEHILMDHDFALQGLIAGCGRSFNPLPPGMIC